MFANFSQELYKKLVQNGFYKIKNFYESTTLDDNSKYIGLLKQEGSVWYAIIVFNMDIINISEFEIINKAHTKFFRQLKEKLNFRNVIITNLMLSKEETIEIKDFIYSLESFIEQGVNNIYWNMKLVDGEVILNKNQPTQILNLRQLLEESYLNTKPKLSYYNFGKTYQHLDELAYEESSYKKVEKIPYVTYIIIFINLLIISIMELNGGSDNIYNLIKFGAIEPGYIIYNKEYYRLLTSMFIHVGVTHFAYNTLALYIFGTRAEKYYGRLNFIIIYILGGLTGSIFSLIFTRGLSAGASGAIFSTIGAVAVITKYAGRDIEGINYYTMIMYILISLGLSSFMTNIDNFGHLGGLIGGVIISYIICKYSKKNR